MSVSKDILFQGKLWKWTNYLSGWQSRFFILLPNGTLNYFSNEYLADSPKATFDISNCDISLSKSNKTLFRILSEDSQRLFLKAESESERQRWAVVIGSLKSSLSQTSEFALATSHQEIEAYPRGGKPSQAQPNIQEKITELKTIQKILLKQMNEFRTHSETFVGNMCESCKILNGSMDPAGMTFHQQLLGDVTLVNDSIQQFCDVIHTCVELCSIDKLSPIPFCEPNETLQEEMVCDPQCIPPPGGDDVFYYLDEDSLVFHDPIDQMVNSGPLQSTSTQCSPNLACSLPVPFKCFFSESESKFQDIQLLDPDSLIPTFPFLQSCQAILSILDALGSHMAIVKNDIRGNISKIEKGYQTDTEKFKYLQFLILQEIDRKTTKKKNSITDATMWLCRALGFIQQFLKNLCHDPEMDLPTAATLAYKENLSKHHPWMVKQIFNLALKASPSRLDFFLSLIYDIPTPPQSEYEMLLTEEMDKYSLALKNLLDILESFYHRHGLIIH